MPGAFPSVFHKGAGPAETARLQLLLRERFQLSEDVTVMVTEIACQVRGCPPLETVFAFWPQDGQRRQFKIFGPAAAIEAGHFPPWWMKDALILPDWVDCECC